MTRIATIVLTDLPLGIWFAFFPIVGALLIPCVFSLADQGKELLAALSLQAAPEGGQLGRVQSLFFALAAVGASAAIAYASALAMRSLRALDLSVASSEDRNRLARYLPAVVTTTAILSLGSSFLAARHPNFSSSRLWWLSFGFLIVTGFLIWRSFSLRPAVDKRVFWGLAIGFALILRRPGWLVPRTDLFQLELFEWTVSVLAGAAALGALLWTSARTSSLWARMAYRAALLVLFWLVFDRRESGLYAFWTLTIALVLHLAARVIATGGTIRRESGGEPRSRSPFTVAGPVIAASALLVVGFSLVPEKLGVLLGAPALFLLAAGAWAIVGTVLLVELPSRRGIPPLTPVVALLPLLWSPFNDTHQLRLIPGPATYTRPPAGEDFLKWYDRNSEGNPDYPVFLVAASGGGLRAAYWTATVLATLDDETCGELRRHVYAISGVSGGSLGAAAYVSALVDEPRRRDEIPCRSGTWKHRPKFLSSRLQSFLSGDFLSPVVGSLLFGDAVQAFLPVPIIRDRAFALERSWEARLASSVRSNSFSEPLETLFARAHENNLPVLIFNSTRVEDGRRVALSSVQLSVTEGYDLLGSLPEYLRLPLSTAVHASARFTYVSPAGTVVQPDQVGKPGSTWGRLVDGGYFENSGTASLSDLAREMHEAWTASGRKGQPRVIALLITNDPSDARGLCDGAGRPTNAWVSEPAREREPRRWMPELLSPVDTILGAREARAPLHERELARRLSDYFGAPPCRSIVEFRLGHLGRGNETLFKRDGPLSSRQPPLGWFLYEKSDTVIKQVVEEAMRTVPFRYMPDCGHARTDFSLVSFEFDPCSGADVLAGGIPKDQRWAGLVGRSNDRPLGEILREMRHGGYTLVAATPGDTTDWERPSVTRAQAADERRQTIAPRWGAALRSAGIPVGRALVSWEDSALEAARLAGLEHVSPMRELGLLGLDSLLTGQGKRDRADALVRLVSEAPGEGQNTVILTHRFNIAWAFTGLAYVQDGETAVFRLEGGAPRLVARILLPQWGMTTPAADDGAADHGR